jgi:hypothetical protein
MLEAGWKADTGYWMNWLQVASCRFERQILDAGYWIKTKSDAGWPLPLS